MASLPQKWQAEALRLGATARLSDDDPAWILIVAAVRLDLQQLADIAAESVNSRAEEQHSILLRRTAHELTKLVGTAIDAASWRRPSQRLILVSITALALAATHALALVAGAHGWMGYLSSEILAIESRMAAMRRESPPGWLTSWSQFDGESYLFVRDTKPTQIVATACSVAARNGTCVLVR